MRRHISTPERFDLLRTKPTTRISYSLRFEIDKRQPSAGPNIGKGQSMGFLDRLFGSKATPAAKSQAAVSSTQVGFKNKHYLYSDLPRSTEYRHLARHDDRSRD